MARITREEVCARFQGPVTSIHTPFCADGSIDWAGVRSYVDFCIENGSRAIILTAGDSQYYTLSDQEVAELTRVVVEQTAGRVLTVAADRMWATGQTVEFARYVRELGADMLMVLPAGWGTGQCTRETLVEHYAAVASEMPVMVVDGRFSDVGMAAGLAIVETLRDRVDGIVAVKDDICGEFGRKLALLVHGVWGMTAGIKRNYLEVAPYGCDAYWSVFLKFKPVVAHEFWSAARAGDWAGATRVVADYEVPYFDFIGTLTGGVQPAIGGTLELFGICKRYKRPPYYSLNDAEMERLADFLRGKGWL